MLTREAPRSSTWQGAWLLSLGVGALALLVAAVLPLFRPQRLEVAVTYGDELHALSTTTLDNLNVTGLLNAKKNTNFGNPSPGADQTSTFFSNGATVLSVMSWANPFSVVTTNGIDISGGNFKVDTGTAEFGASVTLDTATPSTLARIDGAKAVQSYAGSTATGCGAGNFVSGATMSANGVLSTTCTAAGAGFTSTATNQLMLATSTTTAIAYPGSSPAACSAGQAITGQALSATGTLTNTCTAFAQGAVAAVSIGHTTGAAGSIGAINLSTLGTLDWYDCGGSGYVSTMLASNQGPPNTSHAKLAPVGAGTLYTSFQGLNGAASYLAAAVAGDTFSSTAADDQTLGALSSTFGCFYFTAGGSSGWGFRMEVPATSSQRVLRIYENDSSCIITTTAKLTGGTSATDTVNVGANADVVETITFTGSAPGDNLYVTTLCTTNNGGTAQIGVFAASLGPV